MLQKIEKEIADKKLKDDLQSFDDFVFSHFERNNFQITLENQIALTGLRGFILKISQKIIYRILQPTIQEQNAVNCILHSKIKQLEKKIQSLKNPR